MAVTEYSYGLITGIVTTLFGMFAGGALVALLDVGGRADDKSSVKEKELGSCGEKFFPTLQYPNTRQINSLKTPAHPPPDPPYKVPISWQLERGTSSTSTVPFIDYSRRS